MIKTVTLLKQKPFDRVLLPCYFLFLAVLFISCGQDKKLSNEKEKITQSNHIQVHTVIIPVEGMSCGSCVANIKRTVKSLPGVKGVNVSLEKREAVVSYAKGKISPEQMVKTINDLGYKAGKPIQTTKE